MASTQYLKILFNAAFHADQNFYKILEDARSKYGISDEDVNNLRIAYTDSKHVDASYWREVERLSQQEPGDMPTHYGLKRMRWGIKRIIPEQKSKLTRLIDKLFKRN